MSEPPPATLPELADAFVVRAGWFDRAPEAMPVEAELTPDLIDRLRARVAETPGHEVEWWLGAARDWLAAGHTALAERCTTDARSLITADASPSWAQLQALAGLRAVIRERASATIAQLSERRPIEKESRDARRERIGASFFTVGRKHTNPAPKVSAAERIAMDLLSCGRNAAMDHAENWYEVGEYQVIVEQFCIEAGDRGLAPFRKEFLAQLILCGRALLRLGDRTSAYACFLLAEELPPADDRTPEANQRVQMLTQVADYVSALASSSIWLSSDEGARPLFEQGSAVAGWLVRHQLEGLLPQFAELALDRPMKDRQSAQLRQLAQIGRESGWFMPRVLADLNALNRLYDARSRLTSGLIAQQGGGGPLPDALRVPVRIDPPTGLGALPPPPVMSIPVPRRASAPTGVTVPVGVNEGGDDAVITVRPGGRTLAIGPPFGAGFLTATAERLADMGWTVVLVTADAAGNRAAYGRWLKLRPTDLSASTTRRWFDELSRLTTVHEAVIEQYVRQRSWAADPDLAACARALFAELRGTGAVAALCENTDPEVRACATEAIDRAGCLDFSTVLSLRRAAVLLGRLREMIGHVHRALGVEMDLPATAGAKRLIQVQVDLSEPIVASLRAAIILHSLLDLAASPEDEATRAFMSAPLNVAPRPVDPDATGTVRPAAAANPDPPVAPFGDFDFDAPPWVAEEQEDTPWPDMISAGQGPICVLLDAGSDLDWEWLRAPDPRYALIAATAAPTDATLAACRDSDEFLVGALASAERRLFEIAAAWTLPAARVDDLGEHGALHLVRERPAASDRRLVVWPETIGWPAA